MKISVIGCGNMGEAIISGVLLKNIVSPCKVFAYDIINTKVTSLVKKYNIKKALSIHDAVNKSDVIIVAVKPQDSARVLDDIGKAADTSKTIVSIMAGVKISAIESRLNQKTGVARIMPNMAAFCMEALSGISYNRSISKSGKKAVRQIFESIGDIYETKEDRLNAITAVTGSGPAYFFYIAEAMIEAALNVGFSRKDALSLVLKTFHGASGVLKKLGAHPEELRRKVTSKGGTTEQAISIFEKSKVKGIFKDAILAAHRRAEELSR